MKKLLLFIALITGLIAQAQTDPDIWKLDLENRGYTVEETPRESLTLIVVKLSGDTVGIIESAGREGIYILRERLEGGRNLLPCITTDQRDTLAFKLGHQIINTTNDSIIEYWNGSSWVGPIEWLDIQRKSATNDQTGIDQGTDIVLDSANGNITYNASTGVVSLKAGKIYALWFACAVFSISSSETIAIQWVKASDNTPLYEGHETRLRPQSSSSNGNNLPTIKMIYKPTVDIDVKLRCTEYTGTPDTFSMYWDRSSATINEIR